jgi:hypothetical protein
MTGGDTKYGTLVYLGPRVSGPAGVRGTLKGYCLDLPKVGERFRIFQGLPHVDTSVVQRVERVIPGKALLVVTENSVYEWRQDK